MSNEENKEESKNNENKPDKIEEILKNLNASITNKDESSKENQKNSEDKYEENNNKFIKKYKTNDSRLYGITFQNSIESNIINFAVSSLNISKDNNIKILSFTEDNFIENENYSETNIININDLGKNEIKLKSQIMSDFPVSSILFSPHEENKH